MDNAIPLSRGLGSSAAATVGGVVAGAALAELAGATRPDDDALLQIASTIESHPDNAAAVLLGGFVVSAQLADRVAAIRFDAPAGLRCVLYIPDRRLATEDMRGVLPEQVPLRHAVENLGRVAVGVAGIATGRLELLADLTIDRLHEPYRSAAYPELPRLTLAAREAGALGSCLSGAGSTILAFVAPGAATEPDRGGVPRRGRRVRPVRAGRRGRAPQPRSGRRRGLTAAPSGDRLRHRRALDLGAVRHRHRPALDLAEAVVAVERHAASVATRISSEKPSAFAADSQASRIRVPRPWRVRSGRVNIARTLAASVAGSMIRSSSAASPDPVYSLPRRLQPPHATSPSSPSITKYGAVPEQDAVHVGDVLDGGGGLVGAVEGAEEGRDRRLLEGLDGLGVVGERHAELRLRSRLTVAHRASSGPRAAASGRPRARPGRRCLR